MRSLLYRSGRACLRGRSTALGYALLAPSLFGVTAFLLLPMLVVAWLGRRGPATAIAESKVKYEIAAWLEEHAHLFNVVKDGDLRGADLLELVSTLYGKNEVRFNSSIRLKDGKNQLAYDEDVGVQGQIKGSVLDLPARISAGMQLFHGGDSYLVEARLKTRIEGRKLALWYETINPVKLRRDAILATVKKIGEATGIIPLLGSI